MPEYLSPGVYIEEFEIGAKPIEGVSTSTAGFLGETERGPTTPCLITSWLQYQRVYGGYLEDGKYLPGSVDGFFRNGGQRCYIGRIVRPESAEASPANIPLMDGSTMKVDAVGEGDWGNRIALRVSKGTFNDNLIKLDILYWKTNCPEESELRNDITKALKKYPPTVSETFDNISRSKESPDFYEKTVNSISNLITISTGETALKDLMEQPVIEMDWRFLAGGNNGTGALDSNDYLRTDSAATPDKRKGLTAFEEIEDISIVYIPNAYAVQDLVSRLISHCEKFRRFAILDALKGSSKISEIDPRSGKPTGYSPTDSDYAAFYYPWIKVVNPDNKMLQLMPPGGYVAGIYARSDNERGVHKAPANEIVQGASGLEFQITAGEQGTLNPRGVNVIRAFPGRGIRVWGARTLSSNTLWKYINVRRLFIYVESSLERGTQWVVFEPNDDRLWARVRATITQFLTGVWRNGALMGTTAEEAFFVKCDRSTMTQDDIDNGRLICIIGIAPVKPAEFVIFRIAQWQGGSASTE